jgi:hypothetical protein
MSDALPSVRVAFALTSISFINARTCALLYVNPISGSVASVSNHNPPSPWAPACGLIISVTEIFPSISVAALPKPDVSSHQPKSE